MFVFNLLPPEGTEWINGNICIETSLANRFPVFASEFRKGYNIPVRCDNNPTYWNPRGNEGRLMAHLLISGPGYPWITSGLMQIYFSESHVNK